MSPKMNLILSFQLHNVPPSPKLPSPLLAAQSKKLNLQNSKNGANGPGDISQEAPKPKRIPSRENQQISYPKTPNREPRRVVRARLDFGHDEVDAGLVCLLRARAVPPPLNHLHRLFSERQHRTGIKTPRQGRPPPPSSRH